MAGLKRTGFKSQGKPLERKTPMKRGTAQLAAAKPMRSQSVSVSARLGASPRVSARPAKKAGPGLKGRTPTAAERRFMDLAGVVPCVACTIDGRYNPVTSLHHVDGRTKPGAHFKVLPLCGPHHQQDDTDPLQRPSVHERKATFTELYGTELELLAQLYARLRFTPPE